MDPIILQPASQPTNETFAGKQLITDETPFYLRSPSSHSKSRCKPISHLPSPTPTHMPGTLKSGNPAGQFPNFPGSPPILTNTL